MIFDDDVKFCASLVETSDPHRFRSIMAAPKKLRPYYFVIFAFNIEVSRAPYLTKEPMIAEIRIQWWLDALDEIIERKIVRKHAVATPLAKSIEKAQAKKLQKVVLARKWDINSDKFESFYDLKNYLYDSTVILLQVASGSDFISSNKRFQDAGMAIALANYLVATPELKRLGKVPLPGLLLNQIGQQCEIALNNLKLAKTDLKNFTEQERWVLFTGWKSWKILRAVASNPENLDNIVTKFENRRMTLTFITKALLRTF